MSKKIYIGQSGLAREVGTLYVGVNGQARKIKKAYIGVGNQAKQFYPEDVTYKWNRYNIKTTYKWNRYNIKVSYVWDQYKATNTLSYTSTQVDNIRYMGVGDPSGTSYELSMVDGEPKIAVTDVSSSEIDLGESRYVNNLGTTLYGYDDPRYPPVWPQIVVYEYHVNEDSPSDYIYKITGVMNGSYSAIDVYKMTATGEIKRGSYIKEVTSSSSSAYPNDGISGSYWYVYDRETKSRGSFVSSVSSSSSGAYPSNGISGRYWYVSNGSTQSQGSSNGSVTSSNRNQYPDNGVSGRYWYVYAGTV